MFFFIAGIQPKTLDLEDQSRMCPACGLYQARLRRVDHYLSLFFVPLFRVKKGHPLVECRSCGGVFTESGQPSFALLSGKTARCPSCGGTLDPAFRYCPSCGKHLRR
ncbi:MAG: zinc ribbon domain-containing protein [Desulfatiglandales bacterium]